MTVQGIAWAHEVIENIFFNASKEIRDHLSEYEKARSLFDDEASRLAYSKEMAFRILVKATGSDGMANSLVGGHSLTDYTKEMDAIKQTELFAKFGTETDDDKRTLADCLVCVFEHDQYRNGSVAPKNGDVIYDCGACFGETALWFSRFGPKKIYSFEADKKNITTLQRMIKNENLPCEIVDKAIGDISGDIWYVHDKKNHGSGKIVSNEVEGATKIPMISIDDFVENGNQAPDFIKMDIEGAEYFALKGAEKTLKEYKPRLAIALYHTTEDFRRIPILVKSFVPEYRLTCRKNHPFCEFVMYAEADV